MLGPEPDGARIIDISSRRRADTGVFVRHIDTDLPVESNLTLIDKFSTAKGTVSDIATACINALSTQGRQMPFELRRDLRAEVQTPNLDGEYRTDLGEIHDIVAAYPESGIVISIPQGKENLHASLSIPSQEGTTRSAEFVKKVISMGDRLVIEEALPDGMSAYVAIVGYTINEQGYMKLQIMGGDSTQPSQLVALEDVLAVLFKDHSLEYPSVLRIHAQTPQDAAKVQ